MYELMNHKEIMLDIAHKIKTKRIALDYTQEEFSAKSSVALSTYRTFEKSGKGSFENFIAILSALGSVEELEQLLPTLSFSPADIFHNKTTKERMRVKKKSTDKLTPNSKSIEKSSSLLETIRAKNEKK